MEEYVGIWNPHFLTSMLASEKDFLQAQNMSLESQVTSI